MELTGEGSVPGPSVAITFDDACRSVINIAKPILDRFEMCATVFVPTAYVGNDQPMAWPGIDHWTDGIDRTELMPMDGDELDALAAAGWEIGAHTRTHPRLTTLGSEKLAEELFGSKSDVERLTGPCRSIAYPYGDFDARVAAAAGEAGFDAGATLAWGFVDDSNPLVCPRVGIYWGDDMRRFRAKVSRLARSVMSSSVGSRLGPLLR